jgi:hypothetical protein
MIDGDEFEGNSSRSERRDVRYSMKREKQMGVER